MAQLIHIQGDNALNDPRLAPYRNLTDAALRALEAQGKLGRFIAEGPLVVREGLLRHHDELARTGRGVIDSIVIDEGAVEAHQPLLDLAPETLPIYVVQRDVLRSVVGFQFHRGILACGDRPPDQDWLTLARGASALVLLEDLSNHDNVGSIFRSIAALAGPDAGVLITHATCDPLYRKALRVSIGQALRIRFARVSPWPEALGELDSLGLVPVALTPNPAAPSIAEVGALLAGRRPLLLVGAEGPGLKPQTLAHPSVRLARIPMAPGVDSLNAGVAAAIAMSHLMRPLGPQPV